MIRSRRISRSESVIDFTDRKVLELRKVNKFEKREILGA
jgi:hypothetical protein